MTTSISSPSPFSLADLLARHIRKIVRIDALVTSLAALEMILLPEVFIRMHGLGSTPVGALRALGLEWLLFGAWLLWLWNRPLKRGHAVFAIAVLSANALLLLAAPLLFGLGYSPLGWVLTIGTVAFMDLVVYGWWQVLTGRAVA